jgi:death-on-curing protein
MARRRWVPRLVLDAAHLDQLREHGGLPGIRDENALEAALARAQQKHHYEADTDLATLAAACAFGLAKAHPFNDGNKRAAFLAAVIFLGLNGKDLDATEAEVVQVMTALAAGSLTEQAMATWMRERLVRLEL